jgi:hypothetical protein
MRLLNPKHALATLLIVFVVWLAMSGKLADFISYARPKDKPAEVKK